MGPLEINTSMMRDISKRNLMYCSIKTSQALNFFISVPLNPEGNSREPVSWSSEEISVSRGNFLGKMQSVRKARVVQSTGSELREGGME